MNTRLQNVSFLGLNDPQVVKIVERYFDKDVVSLGSVLRKAAVLMAALSQHTKSKWVMNVKTHDDGTGLVTSLHTIHDVVIYRIVIDHNHDGRPKPAHVTDLINQFFSNDRTYKTPVLVEASRLMTGRGNYMYIRYRYEKPSGDDQVLMRCTMDPIESTWREKLKRIGYYFAGKRDKINSHPFFTMCASNPDVDIALDSLNLTLSNPNP